MPTTAALAAALLDHAPSSARCEPHLRAALSHSVSHPGKLVRARLVAEAAVHHGLDLDDALALATAVEYFHTASLLLDDLPCMDDADTRRGLPCVHRLHGDATAILAALAFINRAYALVGLSLVHQPALVRLQVQVTLDACLGAAGLVGGQASDLRFAEGDRSPRAIAAIAAAKTGALFNLAVFLPALCALPDPAERLALKSLCLYWGLAFQTLDDLRDVLSTSVEAGKSTGRDRALVRPNLALALGVPAAHARLHRLVGLASALVHRLALAPAGRWAYLARFHHDHFADPVAESRLAAA